MKRKQGGDITFLRAANETITNRERATSPPTNLESFNEQPETGNKVLLELLVGFRVYFKLKENHISLYLIPFIDPKFSVLF